MYKKECKAISRCLNNVNRLMLPAYNKKLYAPIASAFSPIFRWRLTLNAYRNMRHDSNFFFFLARCFSFGLGSHTHLTLIHIKYCLSHSFILFIQSERQTKKNGLSKFGLHFFLVCLLCNKDHYLWCLNTRPFTMLTRVCTASEDLFCFVFFSLARSLVSNCAKCRWYLVVFCRRANCYK